MVITKTSGEIITVKQRTKVSFIKLGTPGARRWNIVFVRKGKKKEERFPVRDVYDIKGGSMSVK